MSRHGYSDDCDGWALIRWRGAVTSATRGPRGQQLLRDIVAALDALPEKTLAAESLQTPEGDFCTLGAVGRLRGVDLGAIDGEDRAAVARAFGVAEALAAEVMYMNDEEVADDWHYVWVETFGPLRPLEPRMKQRATPNPHAGRQRWSAMRAWALRNLKDPP